MSIFSHGNYKAYLRERIQKMPRQGRGQVLELARELSVHSTLISQILKGDKNFTLEQGHAVCTYFGLIGIEADYFLTLIQIERAGTLTLKNYFKDKLKKLKEDSLQLSKRMPQNRVLTEEEKAQFYSDWIYIAIALIPELSGMDRIDQIAQHFNLPTTKVTEVLQFLLRSGILLEKNGAYSVGGQRTHLEQNSPFVRQHHINWRLRSMNRSSKLSPQELMFTGPVAMSRADFERFREELSSLVKDFIAVVKDSQSEILACLNVDWFLVES